MKNFKVLFISFLILSCVKQLLIVDKSTYNQIPIGTKEILVSVPYSADSLFNNVLLQFEKDRFKKIIVDKEKRITVFKKYLESSESQLFINTSVIQNENGSTVSYTASYGVNLNDKIDFKIWNEKEFNNLIEPVIFTKTPSERTDHCFQYTLLHALNLKGKTIYKN